MYICTYVMVGTFNFAKCLVHDSPRRNILVGFLLVSSDGSGNADYTALHNVNLQLEQAYKFHLKAI